MTFWILYVLIQLRYVLHTNRILYNCVTIVVCNTKLRKRLGLWTFYNKFVNAKFTKRFAHKQKLYKTVTFIYVTFLNCAELLTNRNVLVLRSFIIIWVTSKLCYVLFNYAKEQLTKLSVYVSTQLRFVYKRYACITFFAKLRNV